MNFGGGGFSSDVSETAVAAIFNHRYVSGEFSFATAAALLLFQVSLRSSLDGHIAIHQSLAFSERGQFSQAILQFHVEQMLHTCTPIARFKLQLKERSVSKDQRLCPKLLFKLQQRPKSLWMRLSYLQLRPFCLQFVAFTCGGGTVSKKRPKLISELGGTVIKKDQTDFSP